MQSLTLPLLRLYGAATIWGDSMVVHVINGTISDEERDAYIGIAREKYGEGCAQLDIGYHVTPFEHVRRITSLLSKSNR